MEAFNKTTMAELEKIIASDSPEIEKLIKAFDWITSRNIELTKYEIDLARAMRDQETVVKHQIKMETIKGARRMLEGCYLRVTGKRTKLWEE